MKKVLLLLSIVVVGFSIFYFLNYPRASVPAAQPESVNSISSSRKLFLGARKKSSPQVSKGKAAIKDGCEELTDELNDIDFNEPISDVISRIELDKISECQAAKFQASLDGFKASCFSEFNESACVQQAIFLRALLRTRMGEEKEDREYLADLILKEFAGNAPNFSQLKKISAKLLNFEPNQIAYQKLWAASMVVSQLDNRKSPMEIADEIDRRVDEGLWNDPEMKAIKLALNTGLEPENVEAYARGYLTQKNDPFMHEVLGWALWRQNRPAEAIDQLQKALAINPNDQWLRDQLKKVRAKGANRESYQARISLGINLGDLM